MQRLPGARFRFEEPRATAVRVSDTYPLFLLTGRGSSAQWHTETRTGKSPVLRALGREEPYVEIGPDDAAARAIRPHDWVTITSARGSMRARAVVTPTVGDGQVFVAPAGKKTPYGRAKDGGARCKLGNPGAPRTKPLDSLEGGSAPDDTNAP